MNNIRNCIKKKLSIKSVMVYNLCRINYYKEGDYLYPKFDAVEAYRKAIKTWGKWIDNNINPKKQIVYYRGYSSAHFRY